MKRLALALVFLAASPIPAASAAHCPQGQIWRVHLNTCVGAQTALAHPYVRPPHRLSRPTRVHSPAVRRHVADTDPPDPPPARPATGRPTPPHDEAAIPTFVLPEVDLGAPDGWRFCRVTAGICSSPPVVPDPRAR